MNRKDVKYIRASEIENYAQEKKDVKFESLRLLPTRQLTSELKRARIITQKAYNAVACDCCGDILDDVDKAWYRSIWWPINGYICELQHALHGRPKLPTVPEAKAIRRARAKKKV